MNIITKLKNHDTMKKHAVLIIALLLIILTGCTDDIFPTGKHGYPLLDRIEINDKEIILSDKDITADYYDDLNDPKTVFYSVDFDYNGEDQLVILVPQGSVVNSWEVSDPQESCSVDILQTKGDHEIEGISANVFEFKITGCEHGTVSIICYNIAEKDLPDKKIICQIDVAL